MKNKPYRPLTENESDILSNASTAFKAWLCSDDARPYKWVLRRNENGCYLESTTLFDKRVHHLDALVGDALSLVMSKHKHRSWELLSLWDATSWIAMRTVFQKAQDEEEQTEAFNRINGQTKETRWERIGRIRLGLKPTPYNNQ